MFAGLLPIFTTAATEPAPSAADAKPGKVELDLEGAPFLEEDPTPVEAESEQPQENTPATTDEEGTEEAPKKKGKKKIILIGGVLLLLAAGAAVYFFFLRGEGASKDLEVEPEVIVVPSVPITGTAPVDQHLLDLPAFWVEIPDQQGEMRILQCKVQIPTNNADNVAEFNAKKLIIRDALYYYLHNKSYAFLSASSNMETVKSDMVSIINEYFTTEKIKEILFEEFIIR